MKERRNIINDENTDIVVSIHQNSFPKESVRGAQVFYYKKSEQSKRLAECIQTRLKEFADNSNTRIPKANLDYYILKNTQKPAVIVECGFLSNDEENKNLNSEAYQEKIAWAIYMGITDFCKGLEIEQANA